jgi:hypothetical protein
MEVVCFQIQRVRVGENLGKVSRDLLALLGRDSDVDIHFDLRSAVAEKAMFARLLQTRRPFLLCPQALDCKSEAPDLGPIAFSPAIALPGRRSLDNDVRIRSSSAAS